VRNRTKALLVVLVAIGGLAIYGLFGPDVLSTPERWDPPDPPKLEGVLAPNTRLQKAHLIAKGKLVGPESVAVASDGRIYTGINDGTVVRVDVQKDSVEVFARTGTAAEGCGHDASIENTCGRTLGARFDPKGNLIVADCGLGRLFSIDPSGKKTLLADRTPSGKPFVFLDDLDIASDGTIYFSEASTRWPRPKYRYEVLENNPYGMLLRYSPETKKLDVLLDHLYFANGVTLTPSEDAVLVVETSRYRIQRYWLKGAKAGTAEPFVENLPGIPDNIRRGANDTYWVALGAKRSGLIDFFHPRPTAKQALARIVPLEIVQKYFVPKIGLVLHLDANGKILESLWDESGSFIRQISEANEVGQKLYIGSIEADRIGIVDL
jgi:sugar lactone lactonase YvrE